MLLLLTGSHLIITCRQFSLVPSGILIHSQLIDIAVIQICKYHLASRLVSQTGHLSASMQIRGQPDILQNGTDPDFLIYTGIDLRPERRVMLIQSRESNAQFTDHLARKHCVLLTIVIAFTEHHRLCKWVLAHDPLCLALSQLRQLIIILHSSRTCHAFAAGQCHIMIASVFESHWLTTQIIALS